MDTPMISPMDTSPEAMFPIGSSDILDRIAAIQRDRRYPELLHGPWRKGGGFVQTRQRPASGMIAALVEQSALTGAQRALLAELRLHQFLLCHWYDAASVVAERITADPAEAELPDKSLHVFVGLDDGRILAYTCIQPAGERGRAPQPVPGALDPQRAIYLRDHDRPLFPTERELIGPHVFGDLPALRRLPLAQMREWACSFRNQVVSSPLGVAALYEAFCAPLLLLLDERHGIEVILGNNNAHARKVYVALGAPVLYAPLVPVRPPAHDGVWAAKVNGQGEFWPGVLALADLRAHARHLRQLDAALDLPPREIRRALLEALNRGAPPHPQAFTPHEPTSLLWTSDPYFDDRDMRSVANL